MRPEQATATVELHAARHACPGAWLRSAGCTSPEIASKQAMSVSSPAARTLSPQPRSDEMLAQPVRTVLRSAPPSARSWMRTTPGSSFDAVATSPECESASTSTRSTPGRILHETWSAWTAHRPSPVPPVTMCVAPRSSATPGEMAVQKGCSESSVAGSKLAHCAISWWCSVRIQQLPAPASESCCDLGPSCSSSAGGLRRAAALRILSSHAARRTKRAASCAALSDPSVCARPTARQVRENAARSTAPAVERPAVQRPLSTCTSSSRGSSSSEMGGGGGG
mmetsp:Transcript_46074/g.107638  ORF Transcript_46074/g.107638 Transcript_46074/m.107638 type:complete len:281 (+) Transcript_46074:595-1437(+)